MESPQCSGLFFTIDKEATDVVQLKDCVIGKSIAELYSDTQAVVMLTIVTCEAVGMAKADPFC